MASKTDSVPAVLDTSSVNSDERPSTSEQLQSLLLHHQQQIEMYVHTSPKRGEASEIPQLRAEDNVKLVDDAQALKAKLRAEYGDEIEKLMAEKGHWKYSSKPSTPTNGLPELTDSEKREKRLKELLSDRTPLRASLLQAQEHALNSLIECTEYSLQNNVGVSRSDASADKHANTPSSSEEKADASVTDTATLTTRLGTLLALQEEHKRQMRCIAVMSDPKNFVVGGGVAGDGGTASSRADAAKRAMKDGRETAVEEAFDR